MAARSLRWYDTERNQLVTASPTFLMVWRGHKPGIPISGPWELSPVPRTIEELQEAYAEWLACPECGPKPEPVPEPAPMTICEAPAWVGF